MVDLCEKALCKCRQYKAPETGIYDLMFFDYSVCDTPCGWTSAVVPATAIFIANLDRVSSNAYRKSFTHRRRKRALYCLRY